VFIEQRYSNGEVVMGVCIEMLTSHSVRNRPGSSLR